MLTACIVVVALVILLLAYALIRAGAESDRRIEKMMADKINELKKGKI